MQNEVFKNSTNYETKLFAIEIYLKYKNTMNKIIFNLFI